MYQLILRGIFIYYLDYSLHKEYCVLQNKYLVTHRRTSHRRSMSFYYIEFVTRSRTLLCSKITGRHVLPMRHSNKPITHLNLEQWLFVPVLTICNSNSLSFKPNTEKLPSKNPENCFFFIKSKEHFCVKKWLCYVDCDLFMTKYILVSI